MAAAHYTALTDIMSTLESVIARYGDMARQDEMPVALEFPNFLTFIIHLVMNDEIHKNAETADEDRNYINNTESLCRELLLEFANKKRMPAGAIHAPAVKKYIKTAMLYHRVLFMNSAAFLLLLRHCMALPDFIVYCKTSWFNIFKTHYRYVYQKIPAANSAEGEAKLLDIERVFHAALSSP